MPLPPGLSTVTVTGTYKHPNGTPFTGKLTFRPEPVILTSGTYGTLILGTVEAVLDTNGAFTIALLATDDPDVSPVGWTYRVTERWRDAVGRSYPMSLPQAAPTVDIADIAPTAPSAGEYVVVPGPAGPAGPKGDKGDPGDAGTILVESVNGQQGVVVLDAADVGADTSGAATAAQAAAISAAATDATSKVSAHTAASDPHGDRAAATSALTAHAADATDVHGIADTAALETAAGAQAKADAAEADATATAASDATSKVTAHAGAVDPHGDRAWASGLFATITVVDTLTGTVTTIDGYLNDALTRVAAIEGGTAYLAGGHFTGDVEIIDADLTVRSTPVVLASGDQVLNGEFTFNDRIPVLPGFDAEFANQAIRKAQLDAAVAAAGGGATVRTATARITDDNLSGLPSASSWTVVQTSAGTKLQCSIAAAAGDRIRLSGNFMYLGAHFLDWTLLDSAGAIALYAASDTGSPLSEGNPAMYPSLSFSKMTGPDMFTVSSGHIDGSGNATIALAHQGTSAGTVYAHTTYPWKLLLENIGPEPA